MLKQIEKETNIDFNLVKSWVQRHLKQKNNLIRCNSQDRRVIINFLNGEKVVEIPSKQNNEKNWTAAWVRVYTLCLEALEEKVRYLYINDPLVTCVSSSKIKVGDKVLTLGDNRNDITYINALETIVNTYEIAKEAENEENKQTKEREIKIVHSTVQIDKPSLHVKGNDEEERVKTERLPLKEKKEKKKSINTSYFVGQKVSDDDVLTKDDCDYFKENKVPYVLVTCTSFGKGESVFIKNADLCQKENIPIGAFISGKAVTQDEGIHETKKIIKLLKNYKITFPVVYELNNDEIKYNADDKEKVINIFDTSLQILDVIKSEGYTPILCLDNDVYQMIKDVREEMKNDDVVRHPHIIRILPREKDMVDKNESIILMDPIYDYDIVVIKQNI